MNEQDLIVIGDGVSNLTMEFDTLETGTSNNASDSEVWSRSWTYLSVNRRSPRYCL
jgi:hypothetical protein